MPDLSAVQQMSQTGQNEGARERKWGALNADGGWRGGGFRLADRCVRRRANLAGESPHGCRAGTRE